jgi:D-3-phosphoglycerate dehydrogenase
MALSGPLEARVSKTKIVVPDDFPPVMADSAALTRLRKKGDITVAVYGDRPSSEAALIERTAGAHTVVVMRSTTEMSHAVFEALPELRHVALWGTATDHIAIDSARRLGIAVTNTPNTATDAVAEHALALMLALARRIPELDQRVREGEWPRGLLTQLAGKTSGIVGTGLVGRRMAQICVGIGMNVIATSLNPDEEPVHSLPSGATEADLETLLRNSDVVSIHTRLSRGTVHMFGRPQFALMKPTALFVNTARGRLVDEYALAEALRNESIAGAALDVFEHEPIKSDNPLLQMPNVILSPHTAGTTAEALDRGLNMTVDNVLAFFDGGRIVDLAGR